MALLERVGALLRANLDDLIDRADEPEKIIRQVILDMENQLMQLKTQIAIGITDLHLLEKRSEENLRKRDEWMQKAQRAVSRQQDDLARAAIERALEAKKLAESFENQIADQKAQVETLKSALQKLDAKLSEARVRVRFARGQGSAGNQRRGTVGSAGAINGTTNGTINGAGAESMSNLVKNRSAAPEKEEQVERLLTELKQLMRGQDWS